MRKPKFDISSLMNFELSKVASVNEDKLENVPDYLHNAIDLLNDLNLSTQASKVEKILYKLAGMDSEDLLEQEIETSDENSADDKDELSFEDEV